MRIVMEVRRDANANVLLNNLYKHTALQTSFGINMLSLVMRTTSTEFKTKFISLLGTSKGSNS